MHFVNCPLHPSTMNAIRQQWEKEEAQHNLLRKEWRLEKREHDALEDMWKLQKECTDKDVARRIREELERQEQVRQEWAEEYARYTREKEEERQERIREEWTQEVQKHRHECDEMKRRESERRKNARRKWQREVKDHNRIEEERRKRKEGTLQKLGLFWSGIEAHTCTTYATREYTARLMNLPTTWEHRVGACKAIPLEVHGISYFPKSCEDKVGDGPGAVIGRWEINQHEPDCAPFWHWYGDKESHCDGCTSPGSGKRRIEHHLEGLPRGGDWREFCATTPVRFHGMEFTGAQKCFQLDYETYGHWEIDDADCL
ncbi:hypothetical protein HD554DRAFT_2025946 [Boletus coccyginus]|nr:hypothetical protein HD554DRAFT_2025946 [Boletus coccyginus]